MLTNRDSARDSIHALSDQDLVALLAEEFSRRPTLRPVRDDVTALLAMSPTLALAQEHAVANPAAAAVARTRIVASALGAIVDQHDMLDSTAVSRVLGKAATSRNTASRLTASGTVIALPASGQKLYPAFQFDASRQEVRPIVRELNRRLGAKDDPWGVASWWLSPTAFADDPRSPAELALAGDMDEELRDMADDLTQD
ncbi:conserved hypothetical protein [Rhodococcus sp. RD6.2]|uniref:hypothetical protein n=1 Tax=unclassified Rhodococcus (in: high G+C Gram-positive bacteria) TaxID=192944 RepID=UPI00063B262E|nr:MULTISPECIES: hypothetical protein [unclassified Rhodococcus (in: high G+C Gram-positive bacteria)]CRK51244.1 conserved hypothetical protein [Rhodococcus sp. RD6.2]